MSLQDIASMPRPKWLGDACWMDEECCAAAETKRPPNSIAVVCWSSKDGMATAVGILKKRRQRGSICTESHHQCDDPGYVLMNCVDRAASPLVAQAPLRLELILHGSLREDGVPGQLADPPGTVADGPELDSRDAALVAAN